MSRKYDVFDHREPVLVGDVGDGGIKSVERAYVLDAGGILIVPTFKPFVPFMQMCQRIIFMQRYVGADRLTFPH